MRFFRKRRTDRYYLGEITFLPEFESVMFFGISVNNNSTCSKDLVAQKITAVFDLPKVGTNIQPRLEDFRIDIFLVRVNAGEFQWFNIGDGSFPLFWRPVVELRARVSHMQSGTVRHEFISKSKGPLMQTLRHAISPGRMMMTKVDPVMSTDNMGILVEKVGAKLLQKIVRTIR